VAWETARNDADTREEILIKQIKDSSVMDLKYLAIWLLASMLLGCGCAAALPFSGEAVQLTGNQTEDIVWNESNLGGFCYNLNDGACIGTETLTIGAGALEGPDMQTWWWAVNPGGFSTGNRIWEEGMDTTYRWTARSFAGFYYDLDDGLGTETLTITGINRSLDEGSIVYETVPRSVNFDCSKWSEYDVIGFAAEKCFAGYNSDTDSDITSDTISLISNKMLSKVLIDEDDEHTVSIGASLELKEGYEVRLIQLDIQGDKAQIELLRDGKSVDTGIISNTPSTYVYTKDIGSVDDVPVVAVNVDSVSAGTESDMLVIKGIFQISENYRSIETGDEYGEMEIKSAGGSGITMANDDDVSLDEGEIVNLMGDIKFLVADDSTLRFALYEEITEPGTHDIRGTVYSTTEMPTWTPMNFEGFYYNIDEDLGTERLEVKNTGTNIDDGNLAYTMTVQSVRFDYGDWGKYDVIGFMAEKYFAGYNSNTDNDITDDSISLVSHKLLSKVLIDEDNKHTASTGALLELEEGYELRIVKLDVNGDKAQIELLRDGKSVDTGIIDNTPATYTYVRDIGKVDEVPIVVIQVDSVFTGTESDMITIKGVFQISENYKSIKPGDRYGEMEITGTSSTKITMKNPDTISLNEGGKTMIMGDIGFMTSDDGDRYALFVRRTVGTLNSLEIELPENPVVGEELLIRITSEGAPVEGACVTFGGEYIGLTGSNGDVQFTPDAAGTFMVTASKRNYNSASIAVWVVGGSTATADAVIALQLAVSGEWDADADVSGDGEVTSLDALMILQMVEVPT
jgi:S-layer protein (TIGR01567 family)